MSSAGFEGPDGEVPLEPPDGNPHGLSQSSSSLSSPGEDPFDGLPPDPPFEPKGKSCALTRDESSGPFKRPTSSKDPEAEPPFPPVSFGNRETSRSELSSPVSPFKRSTSRREAEPPFPPEELCFRRETSAKPRRSTSSRDPEWLPSDEDSCFRSEASIRDPSPAFKRPTSSSDFDEDFEEEEEEEEDDEEEVPLDPDAPLADPPSDRSPPKSPPDAGAASSRQNQ